MPDTILGTGETALNQTQKRETTVPMLLSLLAGKTETITNQVKYQTYQPMISTLEINKTGEGTGDGAGTTDFK